jgi:hypothetical protein
VVAKNLIHIELIDVGAVPLVSSRSMFSRLVFVLTTLRSSFRMTRAAWQLEILALRHQINVLRRSHRAFCAHHRRAGNGHGLAPPRFPSLLAMEESRGKAGRPTIVPEVRELIQKLSVANPGEHFGSI